MDNRIAIMAFRRLGHRIWLWLIASVVLLGVLCCTGATTDSELPRTSFEVGLVYLVDHPAIAKGINGFRTGISEIEEEQGVAFSVSYSNAFGDIKNVNTIVRSFLDQRVDAVVALTTPCAQVAKSRTSSTPVIFVGVSDPVGAGLVSSLASGEDNVTGTTSQVPNFEILMLAKSIFPDMQSVGIVYSSSESNSLSILEDIKGSLKESSLDIKLIERPVTNTSDLLGAARSAADESDALFIINDNLVVSSVELLVRVSDNAGIPIFASDIDSVKRGALFTLGLNYEDEGYAAAKILAEILLDGKNPRDIPIYINSESYLYINRRLIRDFSPSSELVEDAEVVE